MKGIFSPLPRAQARFRLFCLPYAGGSSAIYLDWAQYLPPDVELVCIDPPGRAARIGETPVSDVVQLAGQLVREMTPWLDRPFGVLGHSNGALLGFELVRSLRAIGKLPAVLFASAKSAPSLINESDPLHSLPDQELLSELRNSGDTPDEFFDSPELQALFLPVLRADYALSETYRYHQDKPLALDLVLLSGSEDNCMTLADRNCWNAEFSGRHSWHEIEGDHFFIDDNPEQVVRVLIAEIDALRRRQAAISA